MTLSGLTCTQDSQSNRQDTDNNSRYQRTGSM